MDTHPQRMTSATRRPAVPRLLAVLVTLATLVTPVTRATPVTPVTPAPRVALANPVTRVAGSPAATSPQR